MIKILAQGKKRWILVNPTQFENKEAQAKFEKIRTPKLMFGERKLQDEILGDK